MMHPPAAIQECHFRLWRDRLLPGVEFLAGQYARHCFPRHFHDGFVIQVVMEGVNQTAAGRMRLTQTPGTLLVIPPFTVHDGSAASSARLAYRAIYPSVATMREAAGCDAAFRWIAARARLIDDATLASLFVRSHGKTETEPERAHEHAWLAEFLHAVFQRHGRMDDRADDISANERDDAIGRAMKMMHESSHEGLTLERLALTAGVSRFHFLRAFRRRTGLTPHSYLVNLRVERARRELAKGVSIASVAGQCGFSDQSHLNRHFKRIVGITPGRYRRPS